MARTSSTMSVRVLLLGALFGAASAEWLSDIAMASPTADKKALQARDEKFWSAVREAAEDVNLNEHEDLLDSVEGIVSELPSENSHVAQLLRSIAERLQRTSSALFLNAMSAGEIAGEHLSQGLRGKKKTTDVAFSALGDVFGKAIRRFRNVDSAESGYDDEARRGVAERQEDILPMLRQTADVTGNILTDTRLASKEARDVLKYDIYVSGAPKTPEAALSLARKLKDASRKMRQKFMGFVQTSVREIADDTASKEDSPAKVLASNAEALKPFGTAVAALNGPACGSEFSPCAGESLPQEDVRAVENVINL